METSNLSYTKLLRYFPSLSSKTLNPYHSLISAPPPYHSHTLHTLAPCSQISQSGCLSNCNLGSQNLHKKSSLAVSSSGSSSNSCKNLSLPNFSCGLSSSGNLDSCQVNKKQSLCSFSYGSSSDWSLKHPTLFSSLNIYRSSSSYRGLVSVNVGVMKACYGGVFRFFSASTDDEIKIVEENNEYEEVGTFDFDAFLGEVKENDVRAVNVPPRSFQENNLAAGKPLSKLFNSRFKYPSYPNAPKKKIYPPGRVPEIISIIKSDDNDLEDKLSSVALNLYVRSAIEVFEALNCQNVSGLRFFRWVRRTNTKLHKNADFCSLIINNCGWLNDYETMVSLLKEFKSENICLTKEAFGFLPLFGLSKASAMEAIKGIVDLLNEVGGSCRSSGIYAMIYLLCELDLFDMAKFVMEITERTVSRYHILIREKCRRGRIEEARGVIEEMRKLGCHADAKTYNYILGSLCKIDRMDEAYSVLREMKEKGTPPDALSFEIFIYFLCRLGKLDHACQVFDQMVSEGLRPRFTVHASIIKALINAKQYEEAYRYVTDSSLKDPLSSPMIYTLLANLHQKNGDVMSAREIILEMMDKGLKPNFHVYMKVIGRLQGSGKASLVKDLKTRYSRFTSASHTLAG